MVERKTSIWTFVSDFCAKYIQIGFYKYGAAVYRYPHRFVIAGLLITILCGLGLMNARFESDATEVFVPQTADVNKNYREAIDLFGEADGILQIMIKSSDDGNLLTPDRLDSIYSIFLDTINVTMEKKGTVYGFDDLCARKYPGYPTCDAQESNIFLIFDFNQTLWQDQDNIETTLQDNAEYAAGFVGSFIYDDSDNLIGGQYVRLEFALEGVSTSSEEKLSDSYVDAFLDHWEDHGDDYSSDELGNLEISYFSEVALTDELNRTVAADAPLFGVAFLLMLTYLSLTLGRQLNCVEARPLIAFGSLVGTVCAVITGFGMASAWGYTLNSMVFLSPYILLGVSVDGMIIILESLDRSVLKFDVKTGEPKYDHQVADALRHSGLSITLTSLSSVVAFFIGANTDLPGVQSFCIFAALSFLANYCLQFLLVVPLLVWDDARIRNKRNFCLCCIVHENFAGNKPLRRESLSSIKASVELPVAKPNNNEEQNNNNEPKAGNTADPSLGSGQTGTGAAGGAAGAASIEIVDNTDPENKANVRSDPEEEPLWKRINVEFVLRRGLVPLLSKRLNRLIIIVIFFGLLIASLFSLQYLDRETENSEFVPDDSYVIEFLDDLTDAFGDIEFGTVSIIIEDRDFSTNETQNDIQNLIYVFENEFESKGGTFYTTMSQWIDDFDTYLEVEKNVTVNDIVGDSELYYDYLTQFANHSEYKQWDEEILYNYDSEGNIESIKATRFQQGMQFEESLLQRYEAFEDLTDAFNDAMGDDNSGFVDSFQLITAYLAATILELSIQNLIFAGIGVTVALVFLMDIRMSVFIVITIAMIDVVLFGWMVVNDISLNAIAYAQIIMAVGLTVDYVIHISHAIAEAHPIRLGRNTTVLRYNERLEIALIDMGVGVAKGAFTTFLGVCALAFSQSQAFRTFFLMFCGIVLVSIIHGFLFVPAVLGELPFLYKVEEEEKQEQERRDPLKKQLSSAVLEDVQKRERRKSLSKS